MAIPSLLDSYIDETYQRLVQTAAGGTEFADGLGNPITFGTTNTGSLLLTASVSLNTITFTKGDGSTFPITVNTGSGESTPTDTSSFVTTSSFNSFTSSINQATQSLSSSIASLSSSFISFSGSYNTGSFTGSFNGLLEGTASYATTAQNLLGSVENATNASSGSNFVVTSTLRLDESLIDFGKQVGTGTGIYTLFDQATGSFTSAHGKYTLSNGANARAGEFVTVWNGTNITYYDNATTDIGSTTDVSIQSAIVSSQIRINAITLSSGWTIKMLVTYL